MQFERNDLKTLELDRLKTQFFSNVSHDLPTPLALILGPSTSSGKSFPISR